MLDALLGAVVCLLAFNQCNLYVQVCGHQVIDQGIPETQTVVVKPLVDVLHS